VLGEDGGRAFGSSGFDGRANYNVGRMAAYEKALAGLIRDDPEDDLRFHHLVDAPHDKAESGTALTLAIHDSSLRDYITGSSAGSSRWDDEQLDEDVARIVRWQEQIIERWGAADRLAALRAMPYREYLRTPEWQARRRNALAAALSRCEVCNVSENLDVHHRTYERLGAEDEADLTVLCRSCHGLFHEHRNLA